MQRQQTWSSSHYNKKHDTRDKLQVQVRCVGKQWTVCSTCKKAREKICNRWYERENRVAGYKCGKTMQLIWGSLAHLSQSKHSSKSYLGFSRACGSSRARPAGFFSASSWVNNSSSASTLPCFKKSNNVNVCIFNLLLLTPTTLNTIDWKKRKNVGITVHTNTLKFRINLGF